MLATKTMTVDTDTVLQLMRLLPPRERLRVVVEVLPELENELPATAEPAGFWQGSDIVALAAEQGVQPVADIGTLLGGWPEDESVEDLLDMLHQWRQENLAEVRSS
jgi:hypothetical protein